MSNCTETCLSDSGSNEYAEYNPSVIADIIVIAKPASTIAAADIMNF